MTDQKENVAGVKEAIRKAFNTILSVRKDRGDLNAQLAEVREMMVQKGVSKKVFALMQSYLLLDADDREIFKEFFEIFQEVIDAEFAPSLFGHKPKEE